MSVKSCVLLSDLRLLILRNRTDVPFVIGDTPCIASNHYLREFTAVGVLGLSKRGLMLSMPLDSQSYLLLVDHAVYHTPCIPDSNVELTAPGDVATLNSLQVYGSQNCVYFSNQSDSAYVRDFIAVRPPNEDDHLGGFNVLRPERQAGLDGEGELLHTYEPQLPVDLDLSFIRTQPAPPKLNIQVPRKPRLVEQLEDIYQVRRRQGGLPMDTIVRVVESELVVRDS
jgi:hypothetical protein